MTIEEVRKQFEEAKDYTDLELQDMCRFSDLFSEIVIDIALQGRDIDNAYGKQSN